MHTCGQDFRSVLVVEPQSRGHTLTHYAATVDTPAWSEYIERGGRRLVVVCPPRLARAMHARYPESAVPGVFRPEFGPDRPKWNRRETLRALWRATRQGPYDSICLIYLDDLLPLLPLIRLCCPRVHLTGLYMRPMAHFESLGYPTGGKVRRRWAIAWLKNRLLLMALRTGLLDNVLLQDEGAVAWFGEKTRGAVRWLPTPVSHMERLVSIESERVRFLLFGEIGGRKGLFRICEAWKTLPDRLKARIELRLVGQPLAAEREAIEAAVAGLRDAGWRVFSDFRFISEPEIPEVHRQADVLLLPYRNHLGTSGVLVQALYWGIPIIVDDFGWPARMLSRLGAGTAIDTADADAFARAIVSHVSAVPKAPHGAYIESRYSGERFGTELLEILFRNRNAGLVSSDDHPSAHSVRR